MNSYSDCHIRISTSFYKTYVFLYYSTRKTMSLQGELFPKIAFHIDILKIIMKGRFNMTNIIIQPVLKIGFFLVLKL